MARGRFISKYIIEDLEFNELSNDTCRLAYIFLITLADREGRITGDLGYLTSKLFPRRRDNTTEILKGFIKEWANAGFVIWYELENGHKALQLINFEKHQRGLRKDREPTSEFDNPDNCRIIAGNMPDYSQPKDSLINIKGLKDKGLKESLINNININAKPAKKVGINPETIRKQSGKDTETEPEYIYIFNQLIHLFIMSDKCSKKEIARFSACVPSESKDHITLIITAPNVKEADFLRLNYLDQLKHNLLMVERIYKKIEIRP